MLTINQRRDLLEKQYQNGLIGAFDYELESLELRFYTPELKETDEYKLTRLDILKRYNRISDVEYEEQSFDILNKNKSVSEKKIASLEIQYRHGDIDQITFECEKAQVEGKGIGFVCLRYDAQIDPDNAWFEVRFNKLFIKKLREKGFVGDDDNDVADNWMKTEFLNIAHNLETKESTNEPYAEVFTDDDLDIYEEESEKENKK